MIIRRFLCSSVRSPILLKCYEKKKKIVLVVYYNIYKHISRSSLRNVMSIKLLSVMHIIILNNLN